MFQIRCWATTAVLVVNIGCPGVSLAATLNVPADYPTIQACIDAAVSGVDECVVAPGTYHETINFLGKAVTLRSSGGSDVTTIDATGLDRSVVMCRTGEGPDTVLDGFTITGGTGTNVSGYTYGGGMLIKASSPTVTNCTFRYNSANYGGGMYNDLSNSTVTNCVFSGNKASGGGGMYNYYSSPAATNCTFNENIATYRGGGMYNWYGNPTVTDSTFSGNSAYNDGGGMFNAHSNPTVTNCTFRGNMAADGGGMLNADSNPTVTNCTFSGNTGDYNGGGGMYNFYSSPIVTNCTFSGNTSTDTYGAGGGMYNYSIIPTVTNCTFSGNKAAFGGGMKNFAGSPTLINCTFSGNTATFTGGGMYGGGPVANCVFWGDSPNEIANASTVHIIRFSDVQGGLPTGAVDGGGNIDLDPMFVRPPDPGADGTWDGLDDDYGDLRLKGGSPCIDVGDPAFAAQPGETDLEGHARVLCGQVDMGAYEFGIGDYDCNQAVDLTDFASWSSCMTGPSATADTAVAHSVDPNPESLNPACTAFDFDGDGDVDLSDFGGYQRIVGL